MSGKVIMCFALVEIAQRFIKPLTVGSSSGFWTAQPPFPKYSCMVALLLKQPGYRDGRFRQWNVPLSVPRIIASYVGVSGMLASHQHIARGSAHGAAGIVLCEAYAFGSQLIQTGCLDQLLPVDTDIGV